MGAFRDFIPAGEPVDAVGSGFKDFIPTPPEPPKPVEKTEEVKPTVEVPVKKVTRKNK